MEVVCLPPASPLGSVLAEAAGTAGRRLGLPAYLSRLELCLDDLAADERIWLTFGRAGGGAERAAGRRVTLYLHPAHLLKDRPPVTLLPGAVWEMHEGEAGETVGDPIAELSRPKLERFLYHQLLALRDLCDGTVGPAALPRPLTHAFQEVWAVTVDGRLRRERLPGFSAAERRRRFSRVFGRGGVLLPEHWAVFHVLWELEPVVQERLLELLRRLPPLGPRG
jgi:hypothetical protein